MLANSPSGCTCMISNGLPWRDRGRHVARAGAQLSAQRQRSIRVMNRLKAAYRSWAIPCAGRNVYCTRHRSQWLEKIPEAGIRRAPEPLSQQLGRLQHLRQQARCELLAESRHHAIRAKLRQIPSLGPIRSALAVELIHTPHRFRSKRQLWTYRGLGLETRDSGEHHYVRGQVRRRKKQATIRGLNQDYNHDLKGLFKGAATRASVQPGPLQEFYQRSLWPKPSSPP